MNKKSMLSGMLITIIIVIALLIVSVAETIIIEFLGSEVISPVLSVIIDIVIVVVAIIVAIFGLVSHNKVVKSCISKVDEYTEKLAKGDVDWTPEEATYREYDNFIRDLKELVKSTKIQADMARDMSKGDFTIDSHVRSEEDELGIALRDLVDENNQVLSEVQEASMSFTEGAKEVSAASQALAQGSTQQASAVEEINASIKDIATKTTTNADDARDMEQKVGVMLQDAQTGKNAVDAVNVSMNDIMDSSNNISKVIKTIDDIAFQTNILALNATVEAARAGVHGRGFAVVAEEVKNLAELSSNAAKETAELIQHAIDAAQDGSAQVDEMTTAIAKISDGITDISGTVSAVATSSDEQATAIAQVKQAIGQISQVVQTDSATSEECAAAAETLSNHAQNLRDVIAGFKLRGQNNSGFNGSMGGFGGFGGGSVGGAPAMDDSYDDMDNESIISLEGNMGKF